MVRLKAYGQNNIAIGIILFQFQNGSIKSRSKIQKKVPVFKAFRFSFFRFLAQIVVNPQ